MLQETFIAAFITGPPTNSVGGGGRLVTVAGVVCNSSIQFYHFHIVLYSQRCYIDNSGMSSRIHGISRQSARICGGRSNL